ncbi:MAG TPA: hypothetical protein DEA55_02550 [Rhodospirillaceae bacterium]|nr:hypothetical protein [Rhodospirillaceae bacterium]
MGYLPGFFALLPGKKYWGYRPVTLARTGADAPVRVLTTGPKGAEHRQRRTAQRGVRIPRLKSHKKTARSLQTGRLKRG